MEPIATLPLAEAKSEERLLALFDEEIVKQNDRLDELARRLITLELAIPGIYAAALKLAEGGDTALGTPWLLIAAFILWFIALGGALTALFPVDWEVNPNIIRRRDSTFNKPPYAIEEFYRRSASRKWGWNLFSALLFMLGVLTAGFTIFL